MEITPRNSVMICRVAWPEKYVGFSAFTVFLIVYVEDILQSTKGKGIMTFSGILSVPRFTDSITQHAAGCSVHPWAPHQGCLASLLSMAVTSWHQEKNGLMINSNPIAFFLWLQGTPGRASYLALHSYRSLYNLCMLPFQPQHYL